MAIVQERRWAARPRVATGLKLLIYGFPAVLAAVAAVGARRLVAANLPSVGTLGAIVVAFAAASATLVVGERLGRRLLPLVALLKMSLLFPDQMPSRLGVALRAASPKRLARIAASEGYDARSAEHVLSLVAALNAHDRRTRGHSERVRALTMLVAEELHITGEERDKLEWAALLHDVGKMSVPATILNKNGRPDDDEWAVLQGHPAAGAEFSTDLHEWLGPWRHAIDQHHERFDGTGYPLALGGDDIALSGRIVAVTDAFETMTATRAYKKPMSAQVARAELVKCAGSHFDPVVVRAFTGVALVRLHRALGPVSWLTSLPFGAGVSSGVRLGSALVGGATAPVLAATMAAAMPLLVVSDPGPTPAKPAAAEQAYAYEPTSEIVTIPDISTAVPSQSAAHPSGADDHNPAPTAPTEEEAAAGRTEPARDDAALLDPATDLGAGLVDLESERGDPSDLGETLQEVDTALGNVVSDTTGTVDATVGNATESLQGGLDPDVGLDETVSGILDGETAGAPDDTGTVAAGAGEVVNEVLGAGLGGLPG